MVLSGSSSKVAAATVPHCLDRDLKKGTMYLNLCHKQITNEAVLQPPLDVTVTKCKFAPQVRCG